MPPPITRKTSVYLAPDNRIDLDTEFSKKTRQEKQDKVAIAILSFLVKELWKMQIGYIRVSKSDRSQILDLQRDAMIAAGIDPERGCSQGLRFNG